MLRKRISRVEFEKIFQSFNEAVYRGERKKLNYASWRIIQAWSRDEKWEQMEISKEWVRRRNIDNSYSDFEMIFVGPYDRNRVVPNPEELDPNDNSFGSWLDVMLSMETTMAELSCPGISINADSLNGTYNLYQYDHDWDANIISSPSNELSVKLDHLTEQLENLIIEKENKEMKFGNFDFGPVDSSVRMSLYGMAIKNAAGTYVAYDANSKQVMDVDIFNFEGANKFIYKLPVAINDVRCGDVIIHARKPMFVQSVQGNNRLKVLDIFDGEEKVIVMTKSPFGFDFITKVVSFVDMTGTADKSNPFGNMLPFLLLSDSKNTNDMLPFLLMGQNGSFASNPMLMYALLNKDGKANDMLPFLFMSQSGNLAQPNGSSDTSSCENSDK